MPSAVPQLPTQDADTLCALARHLRPQIVKMTARAKRSHVGGGLSMAEILAVLYGSVLHVDRARPDWEARDRFVLSKGAR